MLSVCNFFRFFVCLRDSICKGVYSSEDDCHYGERFKDLMTSETGFETKVTLRPPFDSGKQVMFEKNEIN